MIPDWYRSYRIAQSRQVIDRPPPLDQGNEHRRKLYYRRSDEFNRRGRIWHGYKVEIGDIPMYDLACCKCEEDWRVMLPKENLPFICFECITERYENWKARKYIRFVDHLPLTKKIAEKVKNVLIVVGSTIALIPLSIALGTLTAIIAVFWGIYLVCGLTWCWWQDRKDRKEEKT